MHLLMLLSHHLEAVFVFIAIYVVVRSVMNKKFLTALKSNCTICGNNHRGHCWEFPGSNAQVTRQRLIDSGLLKPAVDYVDPEGPTMVMKSWKGIEPVLEIDDEGRRSAERDIRRMKQEYYPIEDFSKFDNLSFLKKGKSNGRQ